MPQLVMIRHGQSQWNLENRFTGWVDVGLSPRGVEEAHNAGRLLLKEGLRFKTAYTSVLKRAIKTLWIALEEMDMMYIPQKISWRLNERHYGALQGLNKAETAEKYGKEQVHVWRRSYDVPPPEMSIEDDGHPAKDPRYAGVDPSLLRGGESLKLTLERVLPYWDEEIAPQLRSNHDIVIAAHGNSLRALAKHLLSINDHDIPGLEIPTGNPLAFRLDEKLNVEDVRYLDQENAAVIPGH